MKVEWAHASGCPYGQFVLKSETKLDEELLAHFVSPDRDEWKFWMHGHGGRGSLSQHMNFGWVKRKKKETWKRKLKRFFRV